MLELKGHSGLVVALAYAPNGRLLASASADGTARVWDVRDGKLITMLQSPAARAYCVAFAPDGRSLAVGYGGGHGLVQWWELDPLRRRESWAAHKDVTRGLAFNPNGQTLATGGTDGAVRLWNLDTLNGRPLPIKDPSPVHAIAFSPDGRSVAAMLNTWATAYLWNAATLRRQAEHRWPGLRGYSLAFSPDAQTVACGLGGRVALWQPAARQEPPYRLAHSGDVLGVAFMPDGGTLLTGGADGLVHLWDPAGAIRHTFDWRISEIGAVAFAPDGLTAAAGGFETILIWDVEG